jgi:hypothetical protein
MTIDTDALAAKLKVLLTKKVRICIATSEGGGPLLTALSEIPGISSVLMGFYKPYGKEEIDTFHGYTPKSYCDEALSMDRAMMAYYRAYSYGEAPAIGIGLTASVATTEVHRGDHRIILSTFQEGKATQYYIKLTKRSGQANRVLDVEICNTLLINALLEVVGESAFINGLPQGVFEEYHFTSDAMPLADQQLKDHPFFSATGERLKAFPLEKYRVGAVYPGTYDPPHFGHFGVKQNYTNLMIGPVAFSIEAHPLHKDPIPTCKLLQRAKMLKGHDVFLTFGAPLYVDKVKLTPGLYFILGADVFPTVIDPKWGVPVEDIIRTLRKNNSVFFVGDRTVNGALVTLNDISYPKDFPCMRLEGHFDISSSAVRNGERTRGI